MASACTDLTGVVRSVRQFKIDGFSLLSSTLDTNECIKFRWDVDGHKWEIRCYPKFDTLDGPCWVALKLTLLADVGTSNVRARLGCLLVHPRMPQNSHPSEKSVTHAFKRLSSCSDAVLLVPTTSLPVPASPKDDYLTVQCTIAIVKELPEAAKKVHEMPSSNLHQHLHELLETGIGADVMFFASGESFVAHKNILAARSPVLRAEFFGHMRETITPRVLIEDMEAATFKAMLHFIYTDTVPELDRKLEDVLTLAQHLLVAADRYGLDRLKVICEDKLSGGITVDTAATTLALAEQHNCSHLKAKCVEFIVRWWQRRGISIWRQAALQRLLALSSLCVAEGIDA